MLCWGKKGIEMSCALDFFYVRISRPCPYFYEELYDLLWSCEGGWGTKGRRGVTLIEYSCHRPTPPCERPVSSAFILPQKFQLFLVYFSYTVGVWQAKVLSYYKKRNFLKLHFSSAGPAFEI